jgi:membrane protein required for colicin V production
MAMDLGWIDIVMAAVVLLSTVLGLMRGMVLEVLSLLGWIVAYVCARLFGADMAPYVPFAAPGSPARLAAGVVAAFVVALVVWKVLTWFLHKIVRASVLSSGDRLLGGAFGLLRGFVILLVGATLVSLTPLSTSPTWKSSIGAAWLNGAVGVLMPLVPQAWTQAFGVSPSGGRQHEGRPIGPGSVSGER